MSTGVPPSSKTRLLAIAPTSQPSASAARAAVWTDSGRTTISPVPPAAACAARNRAIPGCSRPGSWAGFWVAGPSDILRAYRRTSGRPDRISVHGEEPHGATASELGDPSPVCAGDAGAGVRRGDLGHLRPRGRARADL